VLSLFPIPWVVVKTR